MNRNDELMHYGVLGMKWGQRRARKNYEKAKVARESAKEWDQIARHKKSKGNAKAAATYKRNAEHDRLDAQKYEAKAKRIEKYHTKMAGGKKAYNYTKNQSTGKAIAKSMLLGTYGAHKYNQARAAGDSRLKAGVKGTAYGTINNLSAGGYSIAEPRMGRDMANTAKAGARAISQQTKKKRNR